MQKIFIYIQVSFLILGSLTAQNFIGNINPSFISPGAASAQADTLRILCVMVSFQNDRDETTFGNGKFGSIYSVNYGNSIIDPLPHDRSYFAAHLDFVKNYFAKVSKGNLNIEYYILPDTFSLPQVMRNYSPGIKSDDFTPLAEMASKVWEMADSIYPGTDFSRYNLFAIFHAGVGRDISLPGSIGNERDIPSIYIGENSPQKISVPVSGGSFVINNSMIIPETESRELSAVDGSKVLFEISINGLLVASVASHLGLPDLFNTQTGLSAIGRFGLMDGQSIFAYNGLFPPEPSAWEKIRLGWAEPVTINLNSSDINLAAGLAASAADTVILKIPINSSEYFLVENRNRDTRRDGSRLTLWHNGISSTRVFTKDTTGFLSFDIDSLDGVITDVDEFDWALPGNGIVIWHIDESVINSKIAGNKINNDKNHRGVDVEEADGVQDIGEQFKTLLGDIVIGEGTREDFWYKNNPSRLFKGEFSKDSRPNSNSYSGANSLISIDKFSDISNKMSFRVTFGDSIIKTVTAAQLAIPPGNKDITAMGNNLALLSDTSIYILGTSGSILNVLPGFSKFKTASAAIGSSEYLIGASGNFLNVFITDGSNSYLARVNTGENITAPPVIQSPAENQYQILLGTASGKLLKYSTGSLPSNNPELLSSAFIDSNYIIRKLVCTDTYYSFTGDLDNAAINDLGLNKFSSVGTNRDIVLTKDKTGRLIDIIKDNGVISLYSNKILNKNFESAPYPPGNLTLADLKQDGDNYIIFAADEKINALNLSGSTADNFPFPDPFGIGFTGTPLASDFEGDGRSEIIAYTKDGRIFAVDGGTGKVVDGFPLSAGSPLAGTPVLFNLQGKTSLAAVDSNNIFRVWTISSVTGKMYWSEENGNQFNNSFVDAAANINPVNDFFPSGRAYNYPNPVYNGITQIRYYVSEDSKINIKIFDLAGDLVAELNNDARGGFDNETAWNVNNIQSGVYLARIEARSLNGKTETNIIKIAVVK